MPLSFNWQFPFKRQWFFRLVRSRTNFPESHNPEIILQDFANVCSNNFQENNFDKVWTISLKVRLTLPFFDCNILASPRTLKTSMVHKAPSLTLIKFGSQFLLYKWLQLLECFFLRKQQIVTVRESWQKNLFRIGKKIDWQEVCRVLYSDNLKYNMLCGLFYKFTRIYLVLSNDVRETLLEVLKNWHERCRHP